MKNINNEEEEIISFDNVLADGRYYPEDSEILYLIKQTLDIEERHDFS